MSVLKSTDNEFFNLTHFLKPCQEAVFSIQYRLEDDNDNIRTVADLTVTHLPRLTLERQPGENMLETKYVNKDFQGCKNIKHEFQCKPFESDTYITVDNITVNEFGTNCRSR